MLRPHPEFEPQPNLVGAEMYAEEQLAHVAIDEYWTVSYSPEPQDQNDFRLISHHSEMGEAAFAVPQCHERQRSGFHMPNRLIQVLALAAIGRDVAQSGSLLDLSGHTIKTHRRRAIERMRYAGKEATDTNSAVTTCMTEPIFQIVQGLPEKPAELQDKRLREIIHRIGRGATYETIARNMRYSPDAIKSYRNRYIGHQRRIHTTLEAITLDWLSSPEKDLPDGSPANK